MRELKFRAWNGVHMYPGIPSTTGNWFAPPQVMNVIIRFGFPTGEWLEYEDGSRWSVMQYTGLKDKNGVEIYEGDIVCIGPHKEEVLYGDGQFYTTTTPEGSIGPSRWWEACEVIGNIYKNPELLDGDNSGQ